MFFLCNKTKKQDKGTKRQKQGRRRNTIENREESKKKKRRERQRKTEWEREVKEKAKQKQRETLENQQTMPFLGENRFSSKQEKKEKTRIRRVQGQGPPHRTLKPSKKKQKQKQKRERTRKTPKHQKTPKNELFSYQSKFSVFWEVSKISFFQQLGPKSAPPKKHYKNRVSVTHFLETDLHHEKASFGPRKTKTRSSSYQFFAFFLLLQQQKHKNC